MLFILVGVVAFYGFLLVVGVCTGAVAVVSGSVLAFRWKRFPLLHRTQLALTIALALAGAVPLRLSLWWFGSVAFEILPELLRDLAA